MTRPFTIGIVAGSGPEAGIDLWEKVLAHARLERGGTYRGDVDAPRMEIVSEPALGASMDLPHTDRTVWAALEAAVARLAARCDVYAIACNTLNVYAPRIAGLGLPAALVSFPDTVATWAGREEVRRLGLMAAGPVAALGEWSPYSSLTADIELEAPPDPAGLHTLIEDVKVRGADASLRERFVTLAAGFESTDLLLACTELPLVAGPVPGRRLVDVTDLVAAELVRRRSAADPG